MRGWFASIILIASGEPLIAEEPDSPEIIVTAPGGTIDADEALSVGRDAIDRGTRPDLVAALAGDLPGVSISEAQGNAWAAAITWRGYSVSALQGTEQGMAVYLDGIRFNQPFGDTLMLDLLPEAALVKAELRQPNPVFGRNALGGAIMLQTARGRDLPGWRGSTSVDSFGTWGSTVSYGGQHVFAALEGLDEAGWRDFSPSRLLRGFASVDHQGEGWGLEARLIGADTRLVGNGVAPVELLDADYRAVFTRPDFSDARYGRVSLHPYVELGGTGRLEGSLHYQSLRRSSVNGDLADFGPCDETPVYLCIAEDDDGLDEQLFDRASENPVEADLGIDDYAVFNRGQERTRGGGIGLQFLDEHQTTIGPRRFALGMVVDRYRTDFDTGSSLGDLLEDRSVEDLGVEIFSDDGGITPVGVTTTVRDISLFASMELPLFTWLSMEAGVRWSDDRVELLDRIGTDLNGRHRFRRLSPAIEFDITPSKGVEFSLGYAETTRNPTPAELSCADPQAPCALANFFVADPPLEQVVAKNWHVDTHAEIAQLVLHGALWRSDSRNDIRHVASPIRGRAYFTNLGSSRKQGFDGGVAWQQGGWRLSADYGFTYARFRSAFIIASPSNPAAIENDGEIAVEAGDRIPGIPRHAINFQAGYNGASRGLEATARYRSGQVLFGDEGNDNAPTQDYWVFDVSGYVELAKGVTLVGEVRNIFNRRYATFGTFSEIDEIELAEAPGADDPRAYAPGMPRRLSIGLKFAF